jgi:hypothetical protein
MRCSQSRLSIDWHSCYSTFLLPQHSVTPSAPLPLKPSVQWFWHQSVTRPLCCGNWTAFTCTGGLNGFSGISCIVKVGRDSSVGIATPYGLDGPGIESRWGRDFPHSSRPALGPTQPPIQWYRVSFPGVKRPGRGANQPPPSSSEVKGRIELYLYSPSGPSRPVIGRTVPALWNVSAKLFYGWVRFREWGRYLFWDLFSSLFNELLILYTVYGRGMNEYGAQMGWCWH